MVEKAFVFSDIHGKLSKFEELIINWNRKDKLIILGDMIDRGEDSIGVLERIYELNQEYDVEVLRGNHDQMLLDFVDNPLEYSDLWINNGGIETVRSMNDDSIFHLSFEERGMYIKNKYPHLIKMLKESNHYYEFGKVLFTHAGFNSYGHHWEESSDDQFIWIRDHYKHDNETGLVNVFGHTPTQLINDDKSNNIWISHDKSYIGIDGACAYGGQLNGLLISLEGKVINTYSV